METMPKITKMRDMQDIANERTVTIAVNAKEWEAIKEVARRGRLTQRQAVERIVAFYLENSGDEHPDRLADLAERVGRLEETVERWTGNPLSRI